MGCRPSRHSSGRVADSSWGYNKDGYFQNGSKKKKSGRHGCASQKKPTEFSAFSSTSKTYQTTGRNISQCSKITVRLSTDGSMLEIEKYDIDFHSNNATLFTKDTEWYSEDKSKDTINGFAIGKACLARCESAPQLAPPRPRLNSISENNETDILKVSLHSNGYKPGYLGNKPSIQKLKLSKTFANDRMSNSIVEAEIVSSGSRKSGTVDAEKCFTNGNAPGVSIIDNDCNYHHCPSFTARQTTVVKDETKCTSISPINNRKSITEKKMPVSNLKQNDSIARHTTTISSCSSPVHKRYCTVNIGSSQNETLDSSFNCFSPDSLAINDEETEIKDLRTGVYNSINKFNEFISRRQQLEKLSTYPNDEAVIVHSPADPSNSILSEKGVCNIIVKDSKLGKDSTLKITEHENNLNSNISADSLNYTSNTTVTFHSDFVESPAQLPVPEGKTLSCDLKMSETDLLVNKQVQSYNQTCTKCGRVLNGIGKHKPTCQNSPLCAKNRDSQNNLSFSNGGKIQVTVNECISVVDIEQNPITSESSSDNTSAARSRVDCDKYCEVCAKMCVPSTVDAPTLVNTNDATYILRSQTNNKSSHTGEQTEAVNLEDKTTVTFSSATQYLDVCHKQTPAKTNVVQDNMDICERSKGHQDDQESELIEGNIEELYSESDDDDDEFFDENYCDYDEAEEYYDARHSLYV